MGKGTANAATITDTEFVDELPILHAALGQIVHAFTMAVQFQLVEGGSVGEQLGGRSKFLGQVGHALAKREMPRQFDKANEIATPPAAVTVEQVFLGVDVERGMGLLM